MRGNEDDFNRFLRLYSILPTLIPAHTNRAPTRGAGSLCRSRWIDRRSRGRSGLDPAGTPPCARPERKPRRASAAAPDAGRRCLGPGARRNNDARGRAAPPGSYLPPPGPRARAGPHSLPGRSLQSKPSSGWARLSRADLKVQCQDQNSSVSACKVFEQGIGEGVVGPIAGAPAFEPGSQVSAGRPSGSEGQTALRVVGRTLAVEAPERAGQEAIAKLYRARATTGPRPGAGNGRHRIPSGSTPSGGGR